MENDELRKAKALGCFSEATLLNTSPKADSPDVRSKVLSLVKTAWEALPEHFDIAFSYGLELQKSGNHEAALRIFQNLLDRYPHKNEIREQALVEAQMTGNFDLFFLHAQYLIETEKEPKALMLYALQVLCGNKKDGLAIRLIDKFSEVSDPAFAQELYRGIAMELLQRDKNPSYSPPRARRYLKSLLAKYSVMEKGMGKHAETLILIGASFVYEREYDSAWKAIREAYRANPSVIYGFMAMGIAYAEDQKAFSDYLKECDSRPERNLEQGLVSATVAAVSNHPEEQCLRLKETFEREMKNGRYPCESFISLYSDLLFRQGKKDEAIGSLKLGMRIHPYSVDIKNSLAYTLSLYGTDLELANKLCNETLRADPDSAAYLDTKAWILYKSGRPYEAVQILLTALSVECDEEISGHLREVLLSLGREREARLIPSSENGGQNHEKDL